MVDNNGDIHKVFEKLEEHGNNIQELQNTTDQLIIKTDAHGEKIDEMYWMLYNISHQQGRSDGQNEYTHMILKILVSAIVVSFFGVIVYIAKTSV